MRAHPSHPPPYGPAPIVINSVGTKISNKNDWTNCEVEIYYSHLYSSSETRGQLVGKIECSWWKFIIRSRRVLDLLVNFHHEHSIVPTSCPPGLRGWLVLYPPKYLSVTNCSLSNLLTYLWANTCKIFLDQILVLQKRMMRLIYFAETKDHALPLFVKAKMLPLQALLYEPKVELICR